MKSWRQAIYAMQSIEGIAGGLIGIFIPIYFLTLNYSVAQIFLFFILNNAAILFFVFFAGGVANRLGLAKTLFFRLPFLFVYILLLYNLKNWPQAFYWIAVFSAIEIAFYSYPLNVIFAKGAEEKEMGAQVSNLFAFPMITGLFTPIIGAGVSALFGFKSLFVLAGLFYLVAALPIVFLGKIPFEVNIGWREIIKYYSKYRSYFKAQAILNVIGEIEGYVLPIFIFLTFRNIFSIGFLASFLSLGSAVFMLFVGRFSDHTDKKRILRAGVAAMLLVWLGRYFSYSQDFFYLLSVLAGFFGVLISVPFNSIIYQNAKDNNVESFLIFREIPVALGRILLYCFALLFVAKIKWTFLVAAGSYLLMLFF